VKEDLTGLELVDHNADNISGGTFIMLQRQVLTYTVKVPEGTPGGTVFDISGQWWTDPSDKHLITPVNTTITTLGSTSTPSSVGRAMSSTTAEIGEVVTISVTPNEVSGFYAVREDLRGLELVYTTADNLADGTFVMLQANPFQYRVRIPQTAQPDQKFTITGQWWNDPNDKKSVLPVTTVITVMGTSSPSSTVVRSPSERLVTPGEAVTVTLSPENINGFYAVYEALGPLDLISHTADNFVNGTFIMLQANPFTYEIRVPTNATPGADLDISGQWWTNPAEKFEVEPSTTRLMVESGTSTVSIGHVQITEDASGFEIPVLVNGIAAPGLGEFDLSVMYDPSVVNLTGIGANPEGFNVIVNAQQGSIEVIGTDTSPNAGDFLLLTLKADAISNVASSTELALVVDTLSDAGGNDIRFRTSDGSVTITPGAVLSVAGIVVSEPAGHVLATIRLNKALPMNVTVRVATADGSARSPDDYSSVNELVTILAGQMQVIVTIPIVNDSFVEGDETFTVNLSDSIGANIDSVFGSAVVMIRDDDSADSNVSRTLDIVEVSPNGTTTVTLTPENVVGFYAVREILGDLEIVSHTADNFASGVFVLLQARPFSYTVRIPSDAVGGQQYSIRGEWWTDPLDKRPVTPPATISKVITIDHCGDQDNDGRVTVIDAIIDLQFIVGLTDPTPEQEYRGDVNGDGRFNVQDVVAILQSIVGLIRLPVPCIT
jgi:hypothetical protein